MLDKHSQNFLFALCIRSWLRSTRSSREVSLDTEVEVVVAMDDEVVVDGTKMERGSNWRKSGAVSVIPTVLAVDDEDVESETEVLDRKEEREESSSIG